MKAGAAGKPSADSMVKPGFILANMLIHWLRRLPRSSHPGVMRGFIWIGTRICGEVVGSMPAKPGAETPTIVIG